MAISRSRPSSGGLSIPPEYAESKLGDLTRDQLLELLEASAESGIKITFSGKSNARRLARRVRPRVTRTIAKLGAGTPDERAANLLIEGDNLQAMVTQYRWRGRVDLILTDPPYNTGNDFRYNDRWEEDPNDPGLGDLVSEDDGARRTKWMRFMWPRLQMMKSMLKPGGVLAICIDHRELFRLGQILDELFGEQNRLAIINWQKSYSPRGDNTHISTATEYILVYAKDETRARTRLLPRTADMDKRYSSPDNDPRPWKSGDASAKDAREHQTMVYAIQSPFTGELHYPPTGRHWGLEQRQILGHLNGWGCEFELKSLRDSEERAQVIGVPADEIRRARAVVLKTPLATAEKRAMQVLRRGSWPGIFFGHDGQGRPQRKYYQDDVKKGKVPTTFWADEDYDAPELLNSVSWTHDVSGHSQTGLNELDAIVGRGHGFETVKPLRLIERVIQIWCPPDGLVLDCFAGSGTTGHAVLSLNQQVEASRRFILIEQGRPERGDSYARTLTADRLRRAVSGEWASGSTNPLSGGFNFVQLGKKVDASALLQMEREEMVDTVIASHFDATRRRGDQLISITDTEKPYRYLVARNADDEGFFLVWDGPDKNTDFTESVYEACADEASRAGVKIQPYHVYARLYRFQAEGVRFYQIPDRILADFGLDIRNEPFAEEDEE